MKSLFLALSMGLLVLVPSLILVECMAQRQSQAIDAAAQVGIPFVWPQHPLLDDPEVTQEILYSAADHAGVNLVRTSIGMSRQSRVRVTNFLYLSKDDSAIFQEFSLSNGRWPTAEETHSDSFAISAASQDGPDEIGKVIVLGNAFDVTFRSMTGIYEGLPTGGTYYVEALTSTDQRQFFDRVNDSLKRLAISDVVVEPAYSVQPPSDTEPHSPSRSLLYIVIAVILLTSGSLLLRSGKHIAVMRLFGHSMWSIWWSVVGRLQLRASLATTVAIGMALCFVPGGDSGFYTMASVSVLVTTVSTLLCTLVVSSLLAGRLDLPSLLKGGLQ